MHYSQDYYTQAKNRLEKLHQEIQERKASLSETETAREKEQTEKELERIGTLVQNLLKIARLDAGTIILEKSPENVSEMMADIGRHFAHRARQERKALTLSGDDGTVLLCDQT